MTFYCPRIGGEVDATVPCVECGHDHSPAVTPEERVKAAWHHDHDAFLDSDEFVCKTCFDRTAAAIRAAEAEAEARGYERGYEKGLEVAEKIRALAAKREGK